MVCGALLSVALCFVLAERESWTPRVRRRIPRSGPLRFLAWLFYTGSAGGVLWCFALGMATLLDWLCTECHWQLPPRCLSGASDAAEILWVMLGVLLFAWCYSMSGLLVRRIILPKSVPLVGTTIGLALLGIVRHTAAC